jgi:hypothetical protein
MTHRTRRTHRKRPDLASVDVDAALPSLDASMPRLTPTLRIGSKTELIKAAEYLVANCLHQVDVFVAVNHTSVDLLTQSMFVVSDLHSHLRGAKIVPFGRNTPPRAAAGSPQVRVVVLADQAPVTHVNHPVVGVWVVALPATRTGHKGTQQFIFQNK